MAYEKQTDWENESYVNPTRMNHIEQGIYDLSLAVGNLKFEATTASFVFNNSATSSAVRISDITSIASNKIKWINFFGTGGDFIFYSDTNLYNCWAQLLSGAYTGTSIAKVLIVYTD